MIGASTYQDSAGCDRRNEILKLLLICIV